MVALAPANSRARFPSRAAAEDDLRSRPGRAGIVIQVGADYFVYDRAEDIEVDLSDLQARYNVFEIVRPDFTRRPYAEVLRREGLTLDHIERTFARVFGCPAITCETDGGYCLVAAPGTGKWLTLAEHREKLAELARAAIDVDHSCLTAVRLAGCITSTRSGTGFKRLPRDWRLRDTLAQPIDGRTADMSFEMTTDARGAGLTITPEDVARMSVELSGAPDTFVAGGLRSGSLTLLRQKPSGCAVCRREHDSGDAVAYLNRGCWLTQLACPLADTFVQSGKRSLSLVFPWNDAPRSIGTAGLSLAERIADAGPLENRTFANTTTLGEPAVASIRRGSYLDGSPCGYGKSKAFWATVGDDETVVVVSYRKAFTSDVCAKYGLTSYDTFAGTIDLAKHKRVAVQVDSLSRIHGIPNILLLDEVHGIARHLLDGGMTAAQVKSAPELFALPARVIAAGGRVVALDAAANDATWGFLESLLSRSIPAITTPPDAARAKMVRILPSHQELEVKLCRAFEALSMQRLSTAILPEHRKKIAVFCHYKGDPAKVNTPKSKQCVNSARVYALAHKYGLRATLFNGDTTASDRQKIFQDVAAAVEGCDVFIHTTALEAGVSFEDPRFVLAFSFSMQLGHAEAEFQALQRWRQVKNIMVAFGDPWPAQQPGPTDIRGLKLELEHASMYTGHGVAELDTPRGRLWAMVMLEKNRCAAYYPGRLAMLYALNGHCVQVSSQAVQAAVPARERLEEGLTRSLAEAIAGVDHQDHDVPEEELSAIDNVYARTVYLERLYGVPFAQRDVTFVEQWGRAHIVERRTNYLYATGQRAVPAQGLELAPAAEKIHLLNAVLTEFGFGTLAKPLSVEASALAPSRVNYAESEALGKLFQASSRLFPKLNLRKRPLSRQGFVHFLRAIVLEFVNASLESTNKKDPGRGTYELSYDWPKPEDGAGQEDKPAPMPAGVLAGLLAATLAHA